MQGAALPPMNPMVNLSADSPVNRRAPFSVLGGGQDRRPPVGLANPGSRLHLP
jgi:hypothetical protein